MIALHALYYMDGVLLANVILGMFNSLRPGEAYICVGNLPMIDSDNGLWPGWCQAIIWTDAGIFLFGPLGTNFCEILIEIQVKARRFALLY